jgi:hypothetical protein
MEGLIIVAQVAHHVKHAHSIGHISHPLHIVKDVDQLLSSGPICGAPSPCLSLNIV